MLTDQSLSPRLMTVGSEVKTVCGEIPCSTAVVSTNGLNAEPVWRWPCTARLNWLLRKFWPPTIASTRPSRGSMATSAASGPRGSGSHWSTALRAISCSSRSIDV